MEGFLGEFLQSYSYWGVLFVLLACGFGLPIPEEVVLIAAGYLVFEGLAEYPHMAGLCFAGVLLGDSLIFGFGHHIGGNLIQHRFVRQWITEERRNRVWAYFQLHGNKTIFLGRFLFGMRARLFFTAGSIRMSYWSFLKMDFAAALISVPLMVFVGYYFGNHIQNLIAFIQRWNQSFFLILVLILGALAVILWRRRHPPRV